MPVGFSAKPDAATDVYGLNNANMQARTVQSGFGSRNNRNAVANINKSAYNTAEQNQKD